MSDPTNPGNKSAREIEREVDQSRDSLSATIEALQNRFSVETVVDTVLQSVTKNGGEVSRNLGRTARDNPIPLIMTGVGLAWLMASGSRPADTVRDTNVGIAGPTSAPVPTRIETPAPVERPVVVGQPVSSPATDDDSSGPTLMERAQDKLDDVKDAAHQARAAASDRAAGLQQDVAARYDRARSGAIQSGTDLSQRVEKLVSEQPLIVAALGFAAGVGLGALLPKSRTEDKLIGEYADSARLAAQDLAETQIDKAKVAASAVVDEAKEMVEETADKLDRKTSQGGDLVGAIKAEAATAAERLKDAAKTASEDEGAIRKPDASGTA